jgi:ClpP class serine protease
MDTTWRWSWGSLFRSTRRLFWMALILVVLQQLCGPSRTAAARADLLDRLQQDRSSRVIAMIHRDTVSLFGVPVSSSIGIEDSEAVLRAIRLTRSSMN